MIKTPLSTVIGGAFWTPSATILGGTSKTLNQIIKSLFANNEQGFFYDPNDLSTMFQDAAGTVPVTTEGQAVGLIRDKSGRNNHTYQTTSAARPILQRNATTGAYYLAFDGADDFLRTNNIDFTATDKLSLFAGVRKLSDVASYGMVVEALQSFNIQAPALNNNKGYGSDVKGKTLSISNLPSPHSSVITLKASVADNSASLSAGSVKVQTTGLNSGNFGNYPLYIGRRGGTSLPFNGHIYSLIGIGKLTTDDETTAIEKELAKRVGVTLNV